jgi:hypothetical protein
MQERAEYWEFISISEGVLSLRVSFAFIHFARRVISIHCQLLFHCFVASYQCHFINFSLSNYLFLLPIRLLPPGWLHAFPKIQILNDKIPC